MKNEPRSPKAQETKNLIFTAAAQIVLKEGVERLNTNYIAERAGISIGTLYKYYEDKDAIIADVLEQVIGKRMTRIKESLSLSMLFESSDEVVAKVVDAIFHPGAEEESILEASLLPFVPKQSEYREARARRIDEVIKPLVKALMMVKAPWLRSRDFDSMCFILIQSVKYILIGSYLPEGRHVDRAKLKEEVRRFIVSYLAPEPEAAK